MAKTSILTGTAAALCLTAAGPVWGQALEEGTGEEDAIVITASKRGEDIRDIAGAVSALTDEDLTELNAQSLSDYINRVPGVVFNDYQPGVSEVVVRGVASTTYHEANQATTGYYLNEIPLIEPGFPLVIPDVDAFDLERVEVLRGPQGTLFGSSSLGGAVNYVVKEAQTSGFDAAAQGIAASTRRAGEANYAAKAMVNVPIVEDKLAVRVVALERYDAGYLDNPGIDEDGSNDLRVRGLRGSIVWTPTPDTRVTALSMYQEYDLDDQTYVIFNDDPETFERVTNVAEFQDTSFMLHSLRLDQELGFARLTAIGSYTEKESDLAFDDSIFVGIDPRTDTPQLSGSAGTSKTDYAELRLTSPAETAFSWLIGANYTNARSESTDRVSIEGIGEYIDANPDEFGGRPSSDIAPGDLVQRTVSNNDIREIALFGEAAYTFADVLTLTLGGRLFEYKSEPRLQFLPNAELIPPFDYAPGRQKESGFIPKVSLAYNPRDDLKLYALYSEGFRIGGVNVYSVAAGTPLTFDSDTTQNYEIGARFDLVPNQLSFDIAAYHIDWNDIQARLFVPVTFEAYTTNGGGADIDGVEMTMTLRPAPFMQLSSSLAYTDARLSSLLPDTGAPGGGYPEGTRLPGSSEWTLANQLSFEFDDLPMQPRFGIAHRFLSEAPVAFGADLQRGDYHLLDLNASAQIAQGLELGVFAKNLLDAYGIVNAPFSFAGTITRPRTIGGSLTWNFR
ncbi:TonB-dependent receptor [Pacificimonas flava]|uniref:TonB-dependent receptor n=1 Tax=Pacificimonas flava TaxID=1234595 RepID=M2U9F0_9SPHN|nr:TonB-dependent receptor [Pacificimonas flava]EMD84618.1 TonB-dependent receptor [Pacificimonas flava]MBB5279513.1 outer membrane receptor protein involved in Fe transport [Pacificimonas flava]